MEPMDVSLAKAGVEQAQRTPAEKTEEAHTAPNCNGHCVKNESKNPISKFVKLISYKLDRYIVTSGQETKLATLQQERKEAVKHHYQAVKHLKDDNEINRSFDSLMTRLDKIDKAIASLKTAHKEELREFDQLAGIAVKPRISPTVKDLKSEQLDISRDRHLFLIESRNYIITFFEKLKNSAPNSANQLDQIRDRTLNRLQKDIYKDCDEWFKEEGISKSKAEKFWSTNLEANRQKEARKLFDDAIYDGLAIIQEVQMNKSDLKVPEGKTKEQAALDATLKLHGSICIAMAKERSEALKKEGKIDIAYNFTVATADGTPLTSEINTAQFGEKITSSLEKRAPNADGDVYGVNIHTETVKFYTADGKETSTCHIRSGSFDFDGVEPTKDDENQFELLSGEMLKAECEKFEKMSLSEFKAYCKEKRQSLEPKTFDTLLQQLNAFKKHLEKKQTNNDLSSKEKNMLEALLDTSTDGVFSIDKCAKERERLIKDAAIIKVNQKCLEGVFKDVNENVKKGAQYGLQLPTAVRAVFDADAELSTQDKQNWAMISLQSPVNITESKGLNGFIRRTEKRLAKLQNLPLIGGLIKGALKGIGTLTAKDISELDPIYREMKAYKDQSAKSEHVRKGLYFNFPTNFIGAERVIFNFGPFCFKTRLINKFISGTIDTARSKAIKKETQESVQALYDLSERATKAIQTKLEDKSLSNKDRDDLLAHLNYITSLTSETFQKVGDGTKVELKSVPGNRAQYQILGQVTALAEALGMPVNGHCRSGNNRTAMWSAKAHEIAANRAVSTDGKIPSAREMSGKLVGKKDHWSKPLYLGCLETSLRLQASNKGTAGTKVDIVEKNIKKVKGKKVEDSAAHKKATTEGAFSVAGRAEPDKLLAAMKRRKAASIP